MISHQTLHLVTEEIVPATKYVTPIKHLQLKKNGHEMIHKLWDAFKKGPIVFHPSNFKATQAEK